jgi:hypothetical protein
MYVGKHLFNPYAKHDWSQDDDLLAQMMELTQTNHFPNDFLQRSKAADKFFESDGNYFNGQDVMFQEV